MKMSAGNLVLIILMVVFLIAGIAFGVAAHIGSGTCEKHAAALSAAYTWDLGSGCYIEIEPRKWVPLDSLQ